MTSGPITSWQIDGETMETVTDFILGDSKITADGDCSHETERHLLLGRQPMTNLDSVLKSKICLNTSKGKQEMSIDYIQPTGHRLQLSHHYSASVKFLK